MSLILISILAFLYFEKPANKFVRYTVPKLIEKYIGWRNARTSR
ncbi:hypothetical protein GNIT_2533 [Glaciecola nitratireducens FR1064]|uniref:Uncharacterized protein n=1 Tax=Glaciecola nitratireducens (strain JCM 12485 / KCTC 12276 / FR1064) TaxID=1085623 RepID=G4QM59_GLANF|nr:hypothetical protein GNIT_2533 [Glaciecola nitratireducens FR1064]